MIDMAMTDLITQINSLFFFDLCFVIILGDLICLASSVSVLLRQLLCTLSVDIICLGFSSQSVDENKFHPFRTSVENTVLFMAKSFV